jgi:tetratricopeptide (TPR) repeat protein
VSLLTHLLSIFVATNPPALAASNEIQQATGISVAVPDATNPVEQELKKMMIEDDDAQAEVDKWIRDNSDFYKQGAGEPDADLNQRIRERFASVRKSYEDFLQRHPDSAHGYLAYGSFLNDIGKEYEASQQYEKSRQLDPKNPAVWNNLANYYGEFGPMTNAFLYYAKAIELNPNEPVYYQNFATTVYLFRTDAREFFGINEQQVFDKALALYLQAMKLAPDNFPLATDYAQSYYGIKPLRTNDALVAWTNTLAIARDEVEREGVYLHLARIKMSIGQFDESRAHLAAVTNSALADMKKRLERSLADHEHPPANVVDPATNAVEVVSASAVESSTNVPDVSANVLLGPANAVATSTNSTAVSTNAPAPEK